MSFADKHNKGGINWGIDTKDFPYVKLQELFEMGYDSADNPIRLRGLFINRNKSQKELKEYGPSIVAITDNKLVNLPGHVLDDVEATLADPDDIATIKAGLVAFYVYKYESHGKDCYGFRYIDVEGDK